MTKTAPREQELRYRRWVEDIAGPCSSGYHNLKELKEVFGQIGGCEIIRIGKRRFLIIDHQQLLIYGDKP